MADVKIDEAQARAWTGDVKRKLDAVEKELTKVRNIRNSMPGSDDTVFQLIEKAATTMDEVWTNTCNVFKRGWDALEEGLAAFGKAGQRIEESFQNLQRKI